MPRFAILGLLAMVITSGCAVAPSVPQDTVTQSMSIKEAKAQLRTLKGWMVCSGTSIMANCGDGIKNVVIRSDSIFIDRLKLDFATLPPLTISEASVGSSPAYLEIGPNRAIWVGLGPNGNAKARRLADALLVMKQSATSNKQAEAQFDSVVRTYRTASVRPPMNEDVRRLKVQAEAALRNKQFEDAADIYGEALNLAPWWAAGHYNRALVLAEIHDYSEGVREMRRYLALEPQAQDARVAQDKVYEWEGQISK